MPEQLLGPHRSRQQQPGRRRARPVRRQRHDAGRGEEARPQVDRLRAVGRIRPRGDRAARDDQRRRRARWPGRSDCQCAEHGERPAAGGCVDGTVAERRKSVAASDAARSRTPSRRKRELRELVRDAIVEAFFAAHDGYSIDWLLANPQLQAVFHEECREAGLIGGPVDWNRELLRIRKTGGFPKRGKIKKVHVSDDELDAYDFAAEIAWRLTNDKFHGPSLDEILCDPEKAAYFDRMAKRFAPGFEPANYRWAALRLRKASRDLVDEVKQYHFVFAKRDFARFQTWNRFKPTRLDGQPGIYLLRGENKEPLYVGQTRDLGRRLAQHLECPAICRGRRARFGHRRRRPAGRGISRRVQGRPRPPPSAAVEREPGRAPFRFIALNGCAFSDPYGILALVGWRPSFFSDYGEFSGRMGDVLLSQLP